MARPENPIDPHAGPRAELAVGLRRLRERAGLTYRELAQQAHCSASALSQAANGQRLPTWEITRAFVQACGDDPESWRCRWEKAAQETEGVGEARPAGASGLKGVDDGLVFASISSPAEFHEALKAQRIQAGNPSLRDLSTAAEKNGHSLPRSTLAAALNRTERLPSLELVEAFLSACDVPGVRVEVWRRVWARVAYQTQPEATPKDPRWSDVCPYLGLAAFNAEEADVFFGRERATAALVERIRVRLADTGMVVVTGASGSGKSSLLRAGLLPALRRGALGPRSRHWPQALMTPGTHPLHELASILGKLTDRNTASIEEALQVPENARLLARQVLEARSIVNKTSSSERLVLIVDHFEEVFTHSSAPQGADAFIAALRAMARPGSHGHPAPAVVILAVRGDFYGYCTTSRALAEVMQEGTFVVGPLTESELRSTITGPATIAGLHIEAGLVDIIMADFRTNGTASGFELAALPLLSHTMRVTWEGRVDDVLTHHSYNTLGGLSTRVATSAENTYQALTAAQQSAARTTLLRMIIFTTDGVPVRKRVSRAELDTILPPTDVAAVLDAFTQSRLMVRSGDEVELAHEMILRAWPRLQDWLDTDRTRLMIRGRLSVAAREWEASNRHADFLYRGARLAEAREAVTQDDLTPNEQAFLRASIRADRRHYRVRRQVAVVLVVLSVVILFLGTYSYRQQQAVLQQRRLAMSRMLASEALSGDSDSRLAAQLALAAWRIAPTEAAKTSLIYQATKHSTKIVPSAPLYRQDVTLSEAAFSSDGRRLATVGTVDVRRTKRSETAKTVRLWDVADAGRPRILATLPQPSAVTALAFAPNGRTLAGGRTDGTTQLWDISDPAQPRPRSPVGGLSKGEEAAVSSLAFSPDGDLLAAGHNDGAALLWDLSTPTPHTLSLIAGPAAAATNVAISPDAHTLLIGKGRTLQLWNITNNSDLQRTMVLQASSVLSIAMSPYENTMAVGGDDGVIRLWSLPGGHETSIRSNAGSATAVAFSPDGRMLAAATGSGTISVWDTSTGRVNQLVGSSDGVAGIAFSRRTKELILVSTHGRIQQSTYTAAPTPEQLAHVICATAGPGLTAAEWRQYVNGMPYRRLCPETGLRANT